MKASEVATSLKWLMLANQPAHIIGEPGVGKTSIVHQVSAEVGRDVIYSRLGEMESVDLRGLPIMDTKKGTTRWLRPDEFPGKDCKPTTWFFDEWSQGLPSVQSVAGRILNERRLGEYVLPDQVYVCAASNRAKDRASVNRMPAQVADRFFWLSLEPDVGDWCKWAFAHGVATEVVAYIRWQEKALSEFDPTKDVSPTCRSWENVSDALKTIQKRKLTIPQAIEERVYAGKVGDGRACEFMGFLQVFRKLPDPAAMLMNPDKCELPSDKETATLAAVCLGLSRKANDTNFGRVVTIANRLPAEFGALMVIMATGRDKELCSTRAFIEYADQHQELLV